MPIELLVNFGFIAALLLLGLVFGKIAESRHYRSITKREAQWLSLPTTNTLKPLGNVPSNSRLQLCTGNVVISVDYFKRVLASLRAMFGGQIQAYETLVDRARREAILRMKEDAQGASQIFNVRIETSSISQGRQGSIGSVEVLAYGTAVFEKP